MGVRTLTVRYAKTGAGSIWINAKDVALSKELSRVPLHGAGVDPPDQCSSRGVRKRYGLTILSNFLDLPCRLSARPVPPWVLHAESGRFEYHIALLQGVIGATELARYTTAP